MPVPNSLFGLISYRHESPAHVERANQLAQTLRRDGITLEYDRDHESIGAPTEGWTSWMQHAVEKAAFVIIIWSPGYRDAWDSASGIDGNATDGTEWECRLIRARIYKNHDYLRLINVVLEDDSQSLVPDFLAADYPVYRYPAEFQKIQRHAAHWLRKKSIPKSSESSATDSSKTPSNRSQGLVSASVNFRSTIQTRTKDFVGRRYVFDGLREFFDNEESGYFKIEGLPGTGKTAIIAELVRRRSYLHYFNSRVDGYTSTLGFLQHLSAQLIQRFNLPYDRLPTRLGVDHHIFPNLLDEIVGQIHPDQRLVIAIDALDEVDPMQGSAGANVLYLPSSLPDRLFFVVSSRPKRHKAMPLRTMSAEFVLRIEDFAKENREDVESFLRQQLPRLGLLQSSDLSEEDLVDLLANHSENNFMYLFYVLRAIRNHAYDLKKPWEIPKGLDAYYEDHWRLMNKDAKEAAARSRTRILYYLCELRRPVTRKELASYTETTEDVVQDALDAWDQFLLVQQSLDGPSFSLYHASFRDFLHREKMLDFSKVSLAEVNRSIAGRTLQRLGIQRRTPWKR